MIAYGMLHYLSVLTCSMLFMQAALGIRLGRHIIEETAKGRVWVSHIVLDANLSY